MAHCCVQGFKHEGQPSGSTVTINGVETYVSLPKSDYDATKALVIATDVFGLALNNNKLLADNFAATGIPTYVPNLFADDAIPADALQTGTFDIMGWLSKHGYAEAWDIYYSKVVDGLKAQGVTSIASSGYCYGAALLYVGLKAGFKPSALVFSHPSFLKYEDYVEIKGFGIPFHVNSAGTDKMYPPEVADKVDELFKGVDSYERTHHQVATHGYCVRVDLSQPELKAAYEDANAKTSAFVKKYY